MDKYCIGRHLESSEQVTHDETYLSYITVHSSNTGTVTIHNSDENGAIVFKANVVGAASQHFAFPYPIKLRNGMYVKLTDAHVTFGYFG